MRVGVVLLPQLPWREAAPRWRSVEERGFAHGWTYDHLAWRDLADEPWYATVPTLTAAATVTATLQLGTWVTSPNFRHPVTLAKELMTLDDISAGRLITGVGAGGTGWDAEVLGGSVLPARQRMDRLVEFVDLLDTLLTDPETSRDGEFFTAARARMHPAGSRARIPLVVAANGPRGMRVAAGYDGWATTGPPHDASAATTGARWEAWWRDLAALVGRYDRICAEVGRSLGTGRRMLDLDSAPVFSLSGPDVFDDAAGRARALGFTDVLVHWPRNSGVHSGDPAVLDHVAGRLRDGGVMD
ncbi:LLM class flavin-dependent oxidoreductase [Nakamurella flavida]|uniref:LLM class flavin-dependent oxidoreductase n=1 Tax=Nakamurella flavida TaxID=363630 RepID=A0A938YHH8_9ACTN|nr:LLM class flavin-dependent oxidoreductase [Nakamurella flavida]MBM9476017.1 LLM class flavin-dependent oxidoreductase [Nakamurella flavida]MDP9777240.1 alkanesulfonate monooxygenase SsuD/methylene tetrahydromethanopterin reductase-like flavin-dependent oxidoreductase (luciferase family) [Nakamurella flavida]